MSIVVMLMIFGWSTSLAMFAYFALKESGKLLQIRRRVALWLDNTLIPADDSSSAEGLVGGIADLQ